MEKPALSACPNRYSINSFFSVRGCSSAEKLSKYVLHSLQNAGAKIEIIAEITKK